MKNEIKPVYRCKVFDGADWIYLEKFPKERESSLIIEALYPAAAYEYMKNSADELLAENKKFLGKNAELKEDLQFVERWANHHAAHPNITAQEALSCIQHHPSIAAITKSYKDGVIPATRNPYAEIESLKNRISELEKEDEISDGTIKLCSTILAKIAITLKGEPMELARHGYHDLPELVAVLHLENELNKVQMQEMLTAMRRAVLALAFAAESSAAMKDDYNVLSAAIEKAVAADKGCQA